MCPHSYVGLLANASRHRRTEKGLIARGANSVIRKVLNVVDVVVDVREQVEYSKHRGASKITAAEEKITKEDLSYATNAHVFGYLTLKRPHQTALRSVTFPSSSSTCSKTFPDSSLTRLTTCPCSSMYSSSTSRSSRLPTKSSLTTSPFSLRVLWRMFPDSSTLRCTI